MRKLTLDPDTLRVDSFEVVREQGGEGTVQAQAQPCSAICAYITEASCETQHDCPPPCSQICAFVTQASCQTHPNCPPPCSQLCAYLTEESCL